MVKKTKNKLILIAREHRKIKRSTNLKKNQLELAKTTLTDYKLNGKVKNSRAKGRVDELENRFEKVFTVQS